MIGEYCDNPLTEEQVHCLDITIKDKIPVADCEILMEHYVDKASLRSIGLKRGLTQERTRRYLILALRTLRRPENMSLYCPKEDLRLRLEKIAQATSNQQTPEFQFSTRLTNCLTRNSIYTIEALLASSWTQLRAIRGFGAICERELREYLDTNHLRLKD